MKRKLVFGFFAASFLLSCSNGNDKTSTTTSDSSTSTQNNTASATTDTGSTTSATGGTTASNAGSLKDAMDKMMNDMHGMQMSGDPDHDFATMMKTHHQGAIDMANVELSKGTNAELKQVAQKTIDDSQKDINDLNSFMSSHQPSKKSDFGKNQMDKMMKSMNMDMKMSGDVDKDFAMMMAMHHQDGIQMAKDYLKVGTAEETKKVANNTIKSNGEDLKTLKAHSSMDMSGHDMKNMDMKDMDMKSDKKESSKSAEHSQHQ